MKIDDAIAKLHSLNKNNDYGGYFKAASDVYFALSSIHKEQLNQLLEKPIWDGDILSKTARGDLLKWKLAVRVCFQGRQGYTSATYMAYTVMQTPKRYIEAQMIDMTMATGN